MTTKDAVTDNLQSPNARPTSLQEFVPSEAEVVKLGVLIREHRRRRRVSQAALAAKLRVSDVLVSQWERGKTRVRVEDLMRIASALGVPTTVFVEAVIIRRDGRPDEWDDVARLKAQEQELLGVFRVMTPEQRATVVRVVKAIGG